MLNRAHLARVDLNLLLVFDLLFEERNAGRVAHRLHLSPSAVSHALKRLRLLLKDPLFLPNSKGMIPTERAESLAAPIRQIVEQAVGIIASAEEFDPTTTTRRFRIGAPDGAIAFLIPEIMQHVQASAPTIDLSVLQVLPSRTSISPDQAWHGTLNELDSGRLDIAVLPHNPGQNRFHSVPLYSEDFVVVARRRHAFARDPSLEAFTSACHVLVSAAGDTAGFIDGLLEERGLERRIALTVPSFHMALAAISASDLIGALPRRFATQAARSDNVEIAEPPFPMLSNDLHAILPRAALLDQGTAWLLEVLKEVTGRQVLQGL